MLPGDFLEQVVRPNVVAALKRPSDLRAIVNAILALDALVGVIYAKGRADGLAEFNSYKTDDKYRDELAAVSPSYRVLRDTAAALKHGALDPKRTKARLVRDPQALRSAVNGFGLFRIGDAFGSNVIVIEYQPGPGLVRASSVVADTFRMLVRVVDGGPAETDEDDDRPRSED